MRGGLLLILVTLQRGAELLWAGHNEQVLRARGGVEIGAKHYPLILGLHISWLAWLWLQGWGRPLAWPWVMAFVVLQGARIWVLMTLGRRWTTRVLIVPGEVLSTTGPYRFFRHPNYAVVALEVPVLAMAFGLWGAAICFGLANLIVLAWRIHVEERALLPLRAHSPLGA